MNIHMITVVGSYVKIMPHLLKHYSDLGVNSFHINVHLKASNDPVLAAVERITTNANCTINKIVIGPWHESVNQELYQEGRAQYPNDWFVIADQDELHIYPDALEEIIKYCERHNYDYVEGCFLDRVAADGCFPLVGKAPIWQQFPLAGFISYPLMCAYPRKVVLAKGYVDLVHGQHAARNGRLCPAAECFAQVHHFKWVETIAARLHERAEHYESGAWHSLFHGISQEQRRFLAYYHQHDGAFDLQERRFYLAPCGPQYSSYPYWEEIKRQVQQPEMIYASFIAQN